ncbi:ImmA/IrrE family metallo-endopeptidase [Bacillus atrophaeus]|uniref:ImmA/IrrE family metallo-endopeptidase n=1 Tax=Bacillus atrophaeus TaxID=1452 RepID=UPI00228215B0|nr:ImmA/IrrE family metallo-endopeptidase [Bacillus atrophaeus]MCY8504923.1 ImmA/IrrE family metallo-endopeptidase [Bacillus atrophaeus]MCY8969729.1 ImmA/IrrE family metallo-endopeptidase [Bacillus atrophaeus]
MITIYTNKGIKHKAQSVIKYHGTNNIYKICDMQNIFILKNNLGQANGLLQHDKTTDQYLIHINKKLEHQEFVIAHELGHYFLHKKLNTFKVSNCSNVLKNKLEQQAHIFATELILTDQILQDALPNIREFSKENVASYFKVPLFVAEYKVAQFRNKTDNLINLTNRVGALG